MTHLRAPRRQHIAASLFLFLLSIYLFTSGGHTYAPDDESFFYVAESIVTRGTFEMPNPREYPTVGGRRGVGGHFYAQGGIGQSLLTTPLYLAGRAFSRGYDLRFTGYLTRLVMGLWNPLLTAMTAVLIFAFARALGFHTPVAVVLALAWGLGTFAWIEAKTFYNEPLMGLALLLSFYFALRARQATGSRARGWYLASGLAWGLAAITRFHAILALPWLLLYAGWEWPRRVRQHWNDPVQRYSALRQVLWDAAALAIPAALVAGVGVLGYDAYRFGDPWELGYGGAPGTVSFREALYGLLLSPGKSLFLYAPPVLLGVLAWGRLWRTQRAEAVAWGLYIVLGVLFYVWIEFWHSDGTWGNRYLYPMLPFLILPAGFLLEQARRLTWVLACVLIVVGLAVQLLAVPINFDAYLNLNPNQPARNFEPQSSPLVGHARLLVERTTEWGYELVHPREGILLLDGWLANEAPPEDPFPRYIASHARLGINTTGPSALDMQIVLADYRVPARPGRILEAWDNGKRIELHQVPPPEGADLAFEAILPPHSGRTWIELVTVGSNVTGKGPLGDELGLQVQDLTVTSSGRPLPFRADLSIPPIPFGNPKEAWSWFFKPDLPHFDFWWWYLFFSGLPLAQVLNLAVPLIAGIAGWGVLSGYALWRAIA